MLFRKAPILNTILASLLAGALVACGSGSGSSTASAPGNNGGLDCFATGATVASTTEGSGIALFYNAMMYPTNKNTGTPWAFLEPAGLDLKGISSFNYTTCSAKYDTIINTVVAQDRNKNGTFNDGANDSYSALRGAVAISTSPFVGLGTFFYAAESLGFSSYTTGLTEPLFKAALETACKGTIIGSNLNTTGVCPNGTFMHNFLWRPNGLFNNGSATPGFIGVQSSDSVNGDAGLTWTRGYLLKTYSNHVNTTPFYTAIFDAGSSGTKLSYFYVTPSRPGGKASVSLLFTKKYKDSGINDFMSGQGTISTAVLPNKSLPNGCPGSTALGQNQVGPCVLQPLLDYLTTQLNGIPKSSVKIELFATAGMRTEDIKNGGAYTTMQITNYYENIMRPYVSNSLQYSDVGSFKTINGNSEEGVWSWINLNDLRYNTFATQGRCGNDPIGDVEVGGSSMQVVFPVNLMASDAANVYNVNLNGCSINVYSKTFLGLGGDDARKFMRAYNY